MLCNEMPCYIYALGGKWSSCAMDTQNACSLHRLPESTASCVSQGFAKWASSGRVAQIAAPQ